MTSSVLASLVICFVVQGVSGADKELGQACVQASDTCVHPTLELTCHAFAKKCLIQQDEACNGDGHEYLCVTGAECDSTSNKCTCKTNVYTASDAVCTVAADKYAGACPSDRPCATASNLLCADSFCGCTDATFKPKLSDGTCEALADSQIGQACTASGSECGDAATTFMSCQSEKCACNSGYAGPFGGSCTAIGAKRVGKVCTTANAAEEANCGPPDTTKLECSSDKCACKSGYYGVTGGECVPAAGKLNGGCSGTGKGTCEDSDAVCTGTGAKSCKRSLGGACTGDGDCADSNAVCDEFAKKCLLPTDQTCNMDAKKDKCVTGASCDMTGDTPSNQCKCIDNVYTATNNKCYAAQGKATGTCKATDPKCDDANAECDTGATPRCRCKSGYMVKNADATCESGAVAVMASALTVMMFAVCGRLFTLH